MRLIDADALKKSFISDISLPRIRKVYSDLTVCMEIDNASTVYDIPDNATNGEVLKALFPNERIGHCEDCTDLGDIATFDDDWWNTPYK